MNQRAAKARQPKQMRQVAVVVPSTQRRQPRPARRSGMQVTNVPVATATTIRQTNVDRTHVETNREQVGLFSILPTSQVGDVTVFSMNPLSLSGTRLQAMAQNYQKFRFRRISMTIQSSASTATGGLYVVGYNSNPDAELGTGLATVQRIATLPGSVSANAWRTVTSAAKLEDPNKWYNLDADSEEVMQTTQGYFAMAVQIPASSTGPTVYAVWLDYTIEFKGNSINPVSSFVGLFPASDWARVGATNIYVPTPSGGEPGLPTVVTGAIYSLNPGWPVKLNEGTDVTIRAMRCNNSTGNQYGLFETIKDAQVNNPLNVLVPFDTERTILSTAP